MGGFYHRLTGGTAAAGKDSLPRQKGDCLLYTSFGRSGLTLHGGTPIPERQGIVTAFQKESGPPFCILSLKAAGTLNLLVGSYYKGEFLT